MRGTVAFERLNCSSALYLRIQLNDAVYPVPSCSSGPGSSCPLSQYNEQVLAGKWAQAGSFDQFCDLPEGTDPDRGGVTFFEDLTLGSMRSVTP